MPDTDDLITQTEAAELRGSTVAAINELVRRGRLTSVDRFGRKLVSRAEVEAFAPSKGGRPPKAQAGTAKDPAETTAKLNKAFRGAKEAEEVGTKKAAKKTGKK